MNLAALQTGSEALSGAGTAKSAPVSPRLTQAAHQFEALLMKELLKPLTESSLSEGDGQEGDLNSGSGTLSEFASETLGLALSQQGGLGIADRVLKSLSPKSNPGGVQGVTTEVHRDTALRSLE